MPDIKSEIAYKRFGRDEENFIYCEESASDIYKKIGMSFIDQITLHYAVDNMELVFDALSDDNRTFGSNTYITKKPSKFSEIMINSKDILYARDVKFNYEK